METFPLLVPGEEKMSEHPGQVPRIGSFIWETVHLLWLLPPILCLIYWGVFKMHHGGCHVPFPKAHSHCRASGPAGFLGLSLIWSLSLPRCLPFREASVTSFLPLQLCFLLFLLSFLSPNLCLLIFQEWWKTTSFKPFSRTQSSTMHSTPFCDPLRCFLSDCPRVRMGVPPAYSGFIVFAAEDQAHSWQVSW